MRWRVQGTREAQFVVYELVDGRYVECGTHNTDAEAFEAIEREDPEPDLPERIEGIAWHGVCPLCHGRTVTASRSGTRVTHYCGTCRQNVELP